MHEERMNGDCPLVSVVDDDESVRESLPDLLKELGFSVCTFASGEAFLASECLHRTRCLILDITIPGMSGPDLQRELKHRQLAIPIVFISAHRDDGIRALLIGEGAVDCLFKPFGDTVLLNAMQLALKPSE